MKLLKKYKQFIKENINNYFENNDKIDYTLLENTSTVEDITELCEKAAELGVKSVCVMPKDVKLASEKLVDSNVLVCTVVSFPGGNNNLNEKISETRNAISDGADEVDMVLMYEYLKLAPEGYHEFLVNEVRTLVDICHSNTNKDGDKVTLKVIVESGLLSEEQTKEATDICLEAGADFIKTSTGKVSVGAELNKIKIMYDTIKESGQEMKIKASGGVRTAEDIRKYLPYVDRFGMGYASVDTINGIESGSKSTY